MSKIHQGRWIVAAAAVLALVTIGGTVNAVPNVHAQEQISNRQPTTATDRQGAVKTRLSAVKLKVCENREKGITNIMARIADRGTKQLAVFSTIADRTEAFYTSKGKTLANYDTLVANVTTTKTAAETAVNEISTSSTTFSCDASDPKGIAATFKDNLKSEITALKNYKTAIKDLIVGVKSVESTTASTNTDTTTNKGATE